MRLWHYPFTRVIESLDYTKLLSYLLMFILMDASRALTTHLWIKYHTDIPILNFNLYYMFNDFRNNWFYIDQVLKV